MAGIGLNVGLKALIASQTALETIGHNISNAATPGYSRQRLEISASRSILLRGLSLGSGVDADVVRRTADALIHQRLVAQSSSLGRLDARLGGLGEIESLLGEPGDNGVSALLDGFFGSLSALSASPGERLLRTSAVEDGANLAAGLNQLAAHLDTTGRSALDAVTGQVDEVNQLTRRIHALNGQIVDSEASGAPANDLRDQRELALQDLAGRLDVTFHEAKDGAVQVYSRGQMLVGLTRSYDVTATRSAAGDVTLRVAGASQPLEPRGGSLGGLLSLGTEIVPGVRADLDRLAHNLIFEMNKAHSTGVPPAGSFRQLTATYAFEDSNGDGSTLDELVAGGALPFEAQDGAFYVNVVDTTDGSVATTRVDVDAQRTTVADLVAALDAVPDLSARIDGSGRLQITAANGRRFDFGRRLDAAPDADGTFGGGRASLTAGADGPYALAGGDTLDFVGPLGAFTVTLAAASFADPAQATPEELASALNADSGFATNGLRAVVTAGRVAVQTVGTGSAQGFQVAGGSALGALGWTAGTTVAGHDTSVAVEIGGAYTGEDNETYTFTPASDGTVGTTPGLTVEVRNANGDLVSTLDVGAGYEPGSALELPGGLTVRFGFGELSAAHNDRFSLLALADPDTSDVLGALGLNALFTGQDAGDIALRKDIAADPALLSTSGSGAEGDNGALLQLIGAQTRPVAALDGVSLGGFYAGFVGGVGADASAAQGSRDVEGALMDSLVARREQISGVNVDEELVNMIQFQQAYATAAQFIQVVNQTQNDLLSIII
jgi:flagellar hook-associated protein 1